MKKIRTYFGGAGLTLAWLTLAQPVSAQLTGIDPAAEDGFFEDLPDAINSILSYVMTFAGLLLLLYLIWGGIEWITSGGDKGKVESARNKITNAIIGIIVLAAAYALANFVLKLLGANISVDSAVG